MTDTPRTDAAIHRFFPGHFTDPALEEYVPAEFARTLERELAEAKHGISDVPAWVPVSERLPEEGDSVLIYSPESVDPFHVAARWDVESSLTSPRRHPNFTWHGPPVTHWMPLPEAPK